MGEFQQDFVGLDLEAKGEKLELLQARVEPDFKRDVHFHCKTVIKLSYSVVTRLIWRRILNNYKVMPNLQRESLKEVEQAVEEVLEYIPIIRRQRKFAPRQF